MASRITAGEISNIVVPNQVMRHGYADVFELVKKIGSKEYVHSIYIDSEEDTFYDMNEFNNDNEKSCFNLGNLTDALAEEQLFLANFNRQVIEIEFEWKEFSEEEVIGYILGRGDFYEEPSVNIYDSIPRMKSMLPINPSDN